MFDKFRKFLDLKLESGEEAEPEPSPPIKKKPPAPAPFLAPAPPPRPSVPALSIQGLDLELEKAFSEGKPRGEPFSASIQQLYLTDRPQEYKSTTDRNYRNATQRVKALFEGLHRGDWLSMGKIDDIITDFVNLLKTDRNLLLSLAYLPSSEADYLYTHSVNVSLLSMALATGARYSEPQVREIGSAALLIDVGMMRVPEAIRKKTGPLTGGELFEMRKHPVIGVDLIAPIQGLSKGTALAIYQHHERISGSGYPKRRSGNLIHDFSRIIAIADTYAAMVANRNYRKRHLPYHAMAAIIKLGGGGQLDSVMIRRFLETMSLFPLGSLVRLDSGAIGKIIHANENFTKPTLFILEPSRSGKLKKNSLLDLNSAPEEKIVEALDEGAYSPDCMTGF